MKWTTKEGRTLELKDMETSHIENCIKYCKRKNKEGVLIGGTTPYGDVWADYEYDIFDEDVFEEFREELKRRKK